jgi:uncharacterized protein (DUF1697 family)
MPHFHIALLRGINVGKAKRVAMADLKKLVEGLGFGDARTLLNSGNVVFTSPKPSAATAAAKIQTAIAAELGVECRVIVIPGKELEAIMESNPLVKQADNHSRLMCGIVADPKLLAKLKPLTERDWSPEGLAVGERVVHYWCPNSILESPVGTAVAKALGDGVTSRNWATMLKLLSMIQVK